jgi:hypothetical protein
MNDDNRFEPHRGRRVNSSTDFDL